MGLIFESAEDTIVGDVYLNPSHKRLTDTAYKKMYSKFIMKNQQALIDELVEAFKTTNRFLEQTLNPADAVGLAYVEDMNKVIAKAESE